MQDSQENSGSAVILLTALLVVILILLAVGTGMTVLYLRQASARQQAMVMQERAAAAEAEARLIAEQSRALVERAEGGAINSRVSVQGSLADENDGGSIEDDVWELLSAQQAAWNRGDTEAFMQAYWESEQLTLTTNSKVLRGWQALLAETESRMPPQKATELEYADLQFRQLADAVVLVTGRAKLSTGPDQQVSELTWLWQRFDDRWLIVHQHESRD